MFSSRFKAALAASVLAFASIGAPRASAAVDTFVEFNTTAGKFDVELFNSVTPATVANFLYYLNNNSYTSSIVHRSAVNADGTPFVIQGGGFTLAGSSVNGITTAAPVVNEYSLPNMRGTLAMAKSGGDPNSATSQWFINEGDNSTTLNQANNGGYTVFGQVLGTGMNIVDTIGQYGRYDATSILGGAFGEIPLSSYNPAVGLVPSDLVLVNSVSVVPTPEPSSFLTAAAIGILALRRRREMA